jgi:c-di-GMP-binding flagellar brake protein YcgR
MTRRSRMSDEDPGSEEKSSLPKQLKGMERRRHIRLSLMGVASITARGQEPREVYMGCIGRGGAGLYTDVEIGSGQLVVLDLTLKEDLWTDLDMKFAARVRWVAPVAKLYMVGLKFERMSDDRYHTLLRHLRTMKELQL